MFSLPTDLLPTFSDLYGSLNVDTVSSITLSCYLILFALAPALLFVDCVYRVVQTVVWGSSYSTGGRTRISSESEPRGTLNSSSINPDSENPESEDDNHTRLNTLVQERNFLTERRD